MTKQITSINIPSPCIGDCKMNSSTALCQGCYRSIDEIKNWRTISNSDKMSIVKNLHDRRSQILGTPKRKRSNRRNKA